MMSITDEMNAIFNAGRFEHFEDGMYSVFSRALVNTIERHGNEAVSAIADIIDAVCPETASEALRWMGDIDDAETHSSRLALLQRGLQSGSSSIRDAALIGLSSMGDPGAIPALEEAIDRESESDLWRDMMFVIADLYKGE